MNRKFVMINGLAFSEESDMKKLKKYAKEGWILEGIAINFFYKLKKDKPKAIDYCLDYQGEANEEYFSLLLEAGWTRVVSVGNEMHIFSAAEGTKPIYSDRESEIDKYERVKRQMGKGSIYSLIAMFIFIFVGKVLVSAISLNTISNIIFLLFMASMISFVFNFMPYLAYTYRLRNLKKSENRL